MSKKRVLNLVEILERSIRMWPADVGPILRYLELDNMKLPAKPGSAGASEIAKKIARHLCEMGSNDFATLLRGGEPVGYENVVFDVGVKLKAQVSKESPVVDNEEAILAKLFADAVKNMTDEERRALFRTMKLEEASTSAAIPAGVALAQLLARQYGGFAVYRLAVVAANLVSRALLGGGLSFAANAAITRSVGALLGPAGWIATGAWLAIELAGPAFRKTVPAVVHVAFLRQMLMKRVTIGVVGDGSTGKDALVKAVFGIDTGQVDPVAGSTTEAVVYSIDPVSGAVQLINYPGFNDVRASVNKNTAELLGHTDLFTLVLDVSRGVTSVDQEIFRKVSVLGRPVLVCANKIDLARGKADREKLLLAVNERISPQFVATAFDPDPRIHEASAEGIEDVRAWITSKLQDQDKETAHVWRNVPVSARPN